MPTLQPQDQLRRPPPKHSLFLQMLAQVLSLNTHAASFFTLKRLKHKERDAEESKQEGEKGSSHGYWMYLPWKLPRLERWLGRQQSIQLAQILFQRVSCLSWDLSALRLRRPEARGKGPSAQDPEHGPKGSDTVKFQFQEEEGEVFKVRNGHQSG